MPIEDHKLTGAPFVATANMGGPLDPQFLVVHYTVIRSMSATVATFKSPARRCSAHLIIDETGDLTQMVPFDRQAWHAGPSAWAGRSGCNQFTIGIELVNPGPLVRKGSAVVDTNDVAWTGDVVEARHKNGRAAWKLWAAYTRPQLETLEQVASELVARYGLKDVLGHDDIAPARKTDPGPAFPLDAFRNTLFGRADDGDEAFETTTELNIRKGPAVAFDTVMGSPLARGTRVQFVDQSGLWWHVLVPDRLVEGWVHSRFLTRARAAEIRP